MKKKYNLGPGLYFAYRENIFLISQPKHNAVGAQKNRLLNETVF